MDPLLLFKFFRNYCMPEYLWEKFIINHTLEAFLTWLEWEQASKLFASYFLLHLVGLKYLVGFKYQVLDNR